MFKDLIALIFDVGYDYLRDGYKFEVSFPWANGGEEQEYNILALTISRKGHFSSVSFTENEVVDSNLTDLEYIQSLLHNMTEGLKQDLYHRK